MRLTPPEGLFLQGRTHIRGTPLELGNIFDVALSFPIYQLYSTSENPDFRTEVKMNHHTSNIPDQKI